MSLDSRSANATVLCFTRYLNSFTRILSANNVSNDALIFNIFSHET